MTYNTYKEVNINSKINWRAGLELTEQTFIEHDRAIDGRISSLRIALVNGQFGLLPHSDLHISASFVKRNIEINNLRVTALLRNGTIIDIDENATVAMDLLYEDQYYVAARESNQGHEFEMEGVPMVRPAIEYKIVTLEELSSAMELFPIVKLYQKDGSYLIDTDFTPPAIAVGSHPKLMESLQSATERLKRIADHPNLEPGDATLSIRRAAIELQAIGESTLVSEVIALMCRITQSIEYYITNPNSLTPPKSAVQIDLCDVSIYITWFNELLDWLSTAMDSVVLEDRSIDYERLKREIYDQLTLQLRDEFYRNLHDQLSGELREEIARDVKNPLMSFITGEVREELYKQLHDELMRDLSNKLSPELYDALYKALYVEEVKEDNEFMPLL